MKKTTHPNDHLVLPCGLKTPNRLVKAAMAEDLGPLGGTDSPTKYHEKLYKEWCQGGWGMIITGVRNVHVAPEFLQKPFDIFVPNNALQDQRIIRAWTRYRSNIVQSCGNLDKNKPCMIVQLCHSGRQSPRAIVRKPWIRTQSPSSVRIKMGNSTTEKAISSILFDQPKEMSISDINKVIQQFTDAAVLMKRAGFDGIQLHMAHGYLLSSFLSPNLNRRSDRYGQNKLCLVTEILKSIRQAIDQKDVYKQTPFAIGIKLNSADYINGGMTQRDALTHVQYLSQNDYCQIDFIEISGGSYESFEFAKQVNETASSRSTREGFFIDFSTKCKQILEQDPNFKSKTKPAIIITGGMRTRKGINQAILNSKCDLIGIGRPACLYPDYASRILDETKPFPTASTMNAKIPKYFGWLKPNDFNIIGAGFPTIWYTLQLKRMAFDHKSIKPDPSLYLDKLLTQEIVYRNKNFVIVVLILTFSMLAFFLVDLQNHVQKLST